MKYPLKNTYIFIRHAESEANVKEVIASNLRSDTNHLTRKGRKQSIHLGKLLTKELEQADVIISSPYLRSQETAHLIHSFFARARCVYDGRLGERKMDHFEGKSIHLMHDQINSQSTLWTDSPFEMESYADIFYRMHQWWQEYEDSHSGTTCIVVSHSVPMKLLLGWLDGYRGGYLSPYFGHMDQYFLENAECVIIRERHSMKSSHITRLPRIK